MELTLQRTRMDDKQTFGILKHGDNVIAVTLEPPSRHLRKIMSPASIRKLKLKSGTAIPTGTYLVLITKSPKFGKWLPLLDGVPGFEGVRIHAGNFVSDTTACILVGDSIYQNGITRSQFTLRQVMNVIQAGLATDGKVTLTIKE